MLAWFTSPRTAGSPARAIGLGQQGQPLPAWPVRFARLRRFPRTGLTVALIVAFLSFVGVGRAAEYRRTVSSGGGEATLEVYVPDCVANVRALYLIFDQYLIFDRGEPATIYESVCWRNFFGELDMAMAFVSAYPFTTALPTDGLGQAILDAMAAVGAEAGHPELGYAPFIAWGYWESGYWSTRMAGDFPGRAIGFIVRQNRNTTELKGAADATSLTAVQNTPALILGAQRDSALPRGAEHALEQLEQGNAVDAPWTGGIERRKPQGEDNRGFFHETDIIWPWIRSLLLRRLPADTTPYDSLPKLRALNYGAGWLGRLGTFSNKDESKTIHSDFAIAAASQSPEFAENASWMADETLARCWQDFFDDGVGNGSGGNDAKPPAAPRALHATLGPENATLAWDPSPEQDLAGYNVFRGAAPGGPFWLVNDALLSAPSYLDSEVTSGTSPHYVVRAVDQAGNFSGNSNRVPQTAIDDFVACWRFDEMEGSILHDAAPGRFDGQIYGAQWSRGPCGGALEFDGTDDYVDIRDDDGYPETIGNLTSGTLSCWFRYDSDPLEATIHPVFTVGSGEGGESNTYIAVEIGHFNTGNNKLYFTVYRCSMTVPLCFDSGYNLERGQWYHFVAVVGPDFNTGYLNGVEMTNRHYNFGDRLLRRFFDTIEFKQVCWLGKGYLSNIPYTNYFDGAIGAIRIYDRALGPDEVRRLYDEENRAARPATWCLY